ncbi:hypothetical protein A9Q81_08495 [Gammaproteobacteria bacterium 42_54_T18]|nr:hypothetical protein A9Q81_08495 [Gammaproteobacteria bacterium 42_54_T18]
MTLNDTPIQIVLFLLVLLAVLGFITWNRFFLNNNSKRKNKTNSLSKNQVFTKLITLAIFLIWLIGLSVGVMALGFVVNWYTFDSFLWGPFEIVLLTLLGMLFITSMVIVHSAKRQRSKGQGDDIHEHLFLVTKHLIAQMTFILVVILLLILGN